MKIGTWTNRLDFMGLYLAKVQIDSKANLKTKEEVKKCL